MTIFQALKNQLLQTEEERNRYREETQAYQAQLDQKMNQLAQMQEEVKKKFFFLLQFHRFPVSNESDLKWKNFEDLLTTSLKNLG